jgi:hypothetical protein
LRNKQNNGRQEVFHKRQKKGDRLLFDYRAQVNQKEADEAIKKGEISGPFESADELFLLGCFWRVSR